ncbi:MAG: GNAT family N-acetyltransferase [Bdellovibrionota bacterium]
MLTEWRWKKFEELELKELYEIIRLRERVFVVEQSCAYLDCDGLDPQAWHLAGYKDGILAAYLRVLPKKLKYEEISFGRVVTSPEFRGLGYGKHLTKQALMNIRHTWGEDSIRISAQAYLEKFYASLGFQRQGNEYLEDGIPHIEMLRP